MICARCGKVRGNCVGHEFDTAYGVKQTEAPAPYSPSTLCTHCQWRRTTFTSKLCRQCLETRFRCGLCHSLHWLGECSIKISAVTIYGGQQ